MQDRYRIVRVLGGGGIGQVYLAHLSHPNLPNIVSIDPISGQLTPLFNPRTQVWEDHFALEGMYILPLTAVGRVTVRLLDLNHPDRL